jgi:hypothetical protein
MCIKLENTNEYVETVTRISIYMKENMVYTYVSEKYGNTMPDICNH